MSRRLAGWVAIAVMAAAAVSSVPAAAQSAVSCPLPVFGPGSSYHPKIDPARFGPKVTNPLFPLKVGRIFRICWLN